MTDFLDELIGRTPYGKPFRGIGRGFVRSCNLCHRALHSYFRGRISQAECKRRLRRIERAYGVGFGPAGWFDEPEAK